ncbi:MAG: bifunctional (p)ppGpp synthetase/guanosine-3',5'-bis(diphosphate) 3'-pyrophosphohydrolase [Saprospiraceae bacterium]|nr:bifunctional (p)ppGpp synthetase/guanosine-3',5'-bis(diphosphate) 3'-pyrophosphohydrolase [Saprospiraceae bacterium]
MAVLTHTGYTEEDKVIIQRHYRKLLRVIKGKYTEKRMKTIRDAFELAAKAHENDRRKSGEPYITHPIEVAIIVAKEMQLDATSVVCALLHDTVEDTEITLEIIQQEFGKKVALIIDGLTKISGVVDLTSSDSMQAVNFRKILLTISDDIRVILVKLADRLHNMRTLGSMKREKKLKIASETLFLYAPLAHRLGFYNVKSELEDLALKNKEPEAYDEITQKIQETKAARTRYINEFTKPIKQSLDKAGLKYTITGRPKHIFSIWNKMKKKNVAFEEMYDLFAIRIILDTPPELEKANCWRVYSIVTDHYNPNPERLKDFISNPKANGYESLHTTVMGHKGSWVEVQIRSERMHAIAEMGIAAHWKYKENNTDSTLDIWIKRVREILQNPEESENAIEFINNFKSELFDEEIFTFSPKGDMYILPKGATALDFAFNIHSMVGYQCIGAKVNHKLKPISYELQNGDQIEIITSKKQRPNEDWLKVVKTSKAKGRIRSALKDEKRTIAQEGKEMLIRRLKAMKLSTGHENQHEITNHFGLGTALDLHYEIAKRNIDLAELKKFTIKGDRLFAPKEIEEIQTKDVIIDADVHKLMRKDADLTIMGGMQGNIDYHFAKCCNPIPGDNVFGFVSIGQGIKIHRTTCPNAVQLMSKYGYRIVKVKWTNKKEIAFLTGIKLSGIDDIGLINKITKIISSEMKINIQSLSIETNDGVFDGQINLYVDDTDELDALLKRIKAMEGILSVGRV